MSKEKKKVESTKQLCTKQLRFTLFFEPDFNKAMQKCEEILMRFEPWRNRKERKFRIKITEILHLKGIHQYFWNENVRIKLFPLITYEKTM